MLTQTYIALGNAWPWFRKWTKHQMYQLMAGYYVQDDWTFMNYGYVSMDNEAGVALDAQDEPNRTCIQLYHHVVETVDLRGLDVLEVGSGRGGGAAYVKKYLKPRAMIGIDYSSRAVELCRRQCHDGLSFVVGDAERLPFASGSFDAVINIESAHCYRSLDVFFAQVQRVLRSGGYFLFADFCPRSGLAELDAQLGRSGLELVRRKHITPQIVRALDVDHTRRMNLIARHSPRLLTRLMQQFAGVRGSEIYEQFSREKTVYQSFVLQKS